MKWHLLLLSSSSNNCNGNINARVDVNKGSSNSNSQSFITTHTKILDISLLKIFEIIVKSRVYNCLAVAECCGLADPCLQFEKKKSRSPLFF